MHPTELYGGTFQRNTEHNINVTVFSLERVKSVLYFLKDRIVFLFVI